MTNLLKVSPTFKTEFVVPKGTSEIDLWTGNHEDVEITHQWYAWFDGVGALKEEIKEDDMRKNFTGFWIRTSKPSSLSDDSVTFYFEKESEKFVVLHESEAKNGLSDGIRSKEFFDSFNEALNYFEKYSPVKLGVK